MGLSVSGTDLKLNQGRFIMEVKITKEAEKKIISIWDGYIASDQVVLDTKGKELDAIDTSRRKAIVEIAALIEGFQKGDLNINEFKSALDGYNKRNNFWGFTATKGQMFFNQLVKNERQFNTGLDYREAHRMRKYG